MTERQLIEFISDEDNNLSKSIIGDNGIRIKVTYHPEDLLVLLQLNGKSDSSSISAARNKYKNHYYFILSLSSKGKEVLSPQLLGNEQYSELLQTISFRMSEHLRVIARADTIPLADYALNRTFGMSSGTDLLVVFSKEKIKGKETMTIQLDEFGLGTGPQVMTFRLSDLDNVPLLRF